MGARRNCEGLGRQRFKRRTHRGKRDSVPGSSPGSAPRPKTGEEKTVPNFEVVGGGSPAWRKKRQGVFFLNSKDPTEKG